MEVRTKTCLISVVSALLVLNLALPASGQPEKKRVAYTILLRALDYYDDGRIVETYTETRYVSANGDWRSSKKFHGGPVKETVGIVGRGVFSVDKQAKKLRFHVPYSTNYAAEMASGPRAGKLVKFLGYDAYVVRIPRGANAMFVARAPALNGDVVQIMTRETGFTRIIEPVRIVIGQPSGMTLSYDDFAVEYPKKN
ncbi:MAG TPA: hypothetical protein VFP47_00730 [Pyrinomonadaceae bacterium]|nr:hypothetical protein [Pyrinomonadaceae bacterium]